MKVIITASDLPVPVGTIMEVGAEPPSAWKGKCVPYIEGRAEALTELQRLGQEFDENPEWTAEDFSKARPASEVHGKEVAAAMVKPRASRKRGWLL